MRQAVHGKLDMVELRHVLSGMHQVDVGGRHTLSHVELLQARSPLFSLFFPFFFPFSLASKGARALSSPARPHSTSRAPFRLRESCG